MPYNTPTRPIPLAIYPQRYFTGCLAKSHRIYPYPPFKFLASFHLSPSPPLSLSLYLAPYETSPIELLLPYPLLPVLGASEEPTSG